MSDVPRIQYPFVVEQIVGEDGTIEWQAHVLDLPGCVAAADTIEELLHLLSEAITDWIDTARERGMEIPEPSTAVKYSGKITVRLPPQLHRLLALAAKHYDLSLNAYIVNSLAYRVGRDRASKTTATANIHVSD